MTEADFTLWMETANCPMAADYVVAVTLAETELAQELATRWIDSTDDKYKSAGWNCYCWLLGVRPDDQFDKEKAMKAALEIGAVSVDHGKTSCKTPLASDYIQRAIDKQRIGFKRRNVRC